MKQPRPSADDVACQVVVTDQRVLEAVMHAS